VRCGVWGRAEESTREGAAVGGRSRVVATGKIKLTPHTITNPAARATCVRSQGSPERRDSAVVMVRVARHDVHEVVGSHLEVDVERREMSDAIGCH